MNIQLIPTLIDQFRETFEGPVNDGTWIVDTKPASGVFGLIDNLTHESAFTPPREGIKPIAAHIKHLQFALDLTLQRLEGQNPPGDWASSFNLPAASSGAWDELRKGLRQSYKDVLEFLQTRRDVPVQDWPPINIAGLAAMTAHNAYHLGAIKQLALACLSS